MLISILGPGTWRAPTYLLKSPNRIDLLAYAQTKRECQQRLRKAIDDAEQGIKPTPRRLTTGQWLDRWVDETVKPKLRPRTIESYEYHVNRYLKPALGRVPLARLEPSHVTAMLSGMPEHLSPTTKRYGHAILRTALTHAVKLQLVVRNVAMLVDPPAKAKRDLRPLTREEAQSLLATVEGDPYEALYTLALHTGARQGELLALRWSDVKDGALTIRHTLRQGTAELGEPKTAASRRVLQLGGTARAVLRRHKAAQAAARFMAGRKWQALDFVFSTSKGTPLDAINVTKALKRSLKAAGLPEVRFHDLRHSYATLALEAGVDLAVVSKSLGHSNVSTTADIYLHWTKRSAEQTASVMEAVLVPRFIMLGR